MEPPKRPEPKVSEAEALKILQAAFPAFQETEGKHIEAYLNGWGDYISWSFDLSSDDAWKFGTHLSASVDAMSGRIRQYSRDIFGYEQQIPTGPQAAGRTEAEAQAQAENFLAGLLKDEMAELRLMPMPAGDGPLPGENLPNGVYGFVWSQQYNNVPVLDGAVMVVLDKATLEVRHYFDDRRAGLEFGGGSIKVTADQALQTWIANANPQLAFTTIYTPYGYGANDLRLVYRFDGVHANIDAATGKLVDHYPFEQPGEARVIAAGQNPVLPAELPLTEDAAIALASQLMGLPEGARPQIMNAGDRSPVLEVVWHEASQAIRVSLDRKTGMLLGAWHDSMEGEPPMMERVTGDLEAKAEQAAINLVQTYYSQFLDDLRLDTTDYMFEKESGYAIRNFRFQRYSQGVPVENDGIYVSIDLETLTWQNIHAQWRTQPIPSTNGAVAPEAALKTYFQGLMPQLVYMPVVTDRPMGKGDYMEPMARPTKYALSYTIATQTMTDFVDALTGQKINYDGEPAGAAAAALAQIQGHWAEGELRYLLSTRIIGSVQLNPDAALTRAQALQMILRSGRDFYYEYSPAGKPVFDDVTDESPYYGMLMEAARLGWLQPDGSDKLFRPEAPITRAEFVVWMARALKLGDLAQSELSVNFDYQDLAGLPAEEQKAATFLRAIGLLKPAEAFRGSDALTQAEGAALMARFHNYQFSNAR